MPAASLTDDETVTEANGNLSDRKTSLSVNSLDILSVNELLESVRGPSFSILFFGFLLKY